MMEEREMPSSGTYRLSATSALVLLWEEGASYRSQRAQEYLRRLDLIEGESLHRLCTAVWPFYAEVIKNRKFGVLHLVKEYFAVAPANRQVVIAGAGLDALGIELTELYPRARVFEVDAANMDIKSRLVPPVDNPPKGTIAFLDADLVDAPGVRRSLVAHGWEPTQPTLLVLEGISYYLPPESIRQLVSVLAPKRVVLEYLKLDHEVAPDRVEIPRRVFRHIAETCGLPAISQYNYDIIHRLLHPLTATGRYSLQKLEHLRTGANRHFPTAASGWIEVCLLENAQR